MTVERWMKHPVVTVKPLDSIEHSRTLMEQHRINQLPVVVGRRLVGIVTDRDVRDAYPSLAEEVEASRRGGHAATPVDKITVESVMSANVLTVAPGDRIEDAARTMRRERVGALPVCRGDDLVGIITRSDVLDAFVARVEQTTAL